MELQFIVQSTCCLPGHKSHVFSSSSHADSGELQHMCKLLQILSQKQHESMQQRCVNLRSAGGNLVPLQMERVIVPTTLFHSREIYRVPERGHGMR